MKCFRIFTILMFFQFSVFAQINRVISNTSVSKSIHLFQQQDDVYQYREDNYDPRHEGIKENKTQNVTSDKIELLSAKVYSDIHNEYSDSTLVHLGFYTSEKASPEVHINYDPKLYYMDPAKEQWELGFNNFRWPAGIMVRNDIPIDELHARVILIRNGNRILYPACIYAHESPDTIHYYQFAVVPLMTMKIQYFIIDVNSEKVIYSGDFEEVSANQIRSFVWQCVDENGSPLADGEYALRLNGEYRNYVGHLKKVNVAYSYIHKSRFLE